MLTPVVDEILAPGIVGLRDRCDHWTELPILFLMRDDGVWEELIECGRCGRWRKLLARPA